MEKEIWKDIKGYEGLYRISNYGIIKSYDKYIILNTGGKRYFKSRIMKQQIDKDGYYRIKLCNAGINTYYFVHYLVAYNFIGERSDGMQVCHNDGNNKNNYVENLRYDTSKENSKDMIKHGTVLFGENSSRSKLSDELVISIRKEYESGRYSAKALSIKYDISSGTIESVVSNRTWRHLPLCRGRGKYRHLKKEEKVELQKIVNSGLYNLDKICKLYSIRRRTLSEISNGRF